MDSPDLTKVIEKLNALPAKAARTRSSNKSRTLAALAPHLERLHSAKGYTAKEIAEILARDGIHVSRHTVGEYLRKTRQTAAT